MKTDSKNKNTQVFFYTGCVYKIQRVLVICNKGVINIRCSYEGKKSYRV